jgi:uncharacterized membrane protein SpoIIM required for sporulation
VDLDAFVTEHGGEWNRLQLLVGRPRRKLTAGEIDEMVVLYRRTATHLSVVQSRSPDPTLVAWLSRLVLQARSAVTPSTGASWGALGRFFAVSFPVEVYRAARWWVSISVGFIALSAVLMAIVSADPTRFMSQDEISQLVNNDFEAYYSSAAPQNFAFAVWTNNAFLTAISLAGGVLVVPSLLVLWNTGFNLGMVGGVMIANGRSDVFFGLILVHGLLELTCIFIAAGVGLRIGWAWIAPGPLRTRTQAVAEAGRAGMVVALGMVVPLLVSGGIEAFVTPTPLPPVFKVTFGAVVWAAFLGYVVVLGRSAIQRAETGDVAATEREALAPTV